MTEYLKREDVRRAVLHNEGDAVIAAIDELPVTEIVHCGDCEAFERLEQGHPAGYCKRDRKGCFSGSWDIDIKRIRREDHFCRDGWKGDRNNLDEPTVTELPGWIPVTERLPENDDPVLVYFTWKTFPGGDVDMTAYHPREQRWETTWNITHWMPLPQPPEV